MHSINLYLLSREIPEEILPLYEKSLSDREEEIKIRKEEIKQIRTLTDNIMVYNEEADVLKNWFYSFTIPQIGKEFDLLKIGNKIINIELKSQEVPIETIKKQLIQNKYYLQFISDEVYNFTFIECENGENKYYKLENDSLYLSSIEEIINVVNSVQESLEENIERLFQPKNYLISPLNTPIKFLEDKYYLTNQQKQIKNRIVEKIKNEKVLFGIRGSAGTGKTLLLYDIVKNLSKFNSVGVIHCGILNDGHKYLNRHMDNVSIIDAKSITKEWILDYNVICIDETQRLYKCSLDLIVEKFDDGKLSACIFSYDSAQALSKTEVNRNNIKRLNEIPLFHEEELSKKIRSNNEILSFTRNMLRLYDKPRKAINYSNIDIIYANDVDEADRSARYYRENGYMQIAFTPSKFHVNSIDHYARHINSHQVIGQEFDNVLIVMDNNFRYSLEGELQGKEHPNPDYLFPRLFYQNISRAREKLCIVVVGNIELFDKLLQLKENKLNITNLDSNI